MNPPRGLRTRDRSQSDRTLRVLSDWRWHSIGEIHQHAGTMRLNSRVAELRSRSRRDSLGWTIVHSIRDGEHGYQLVSLEEGAAHTVPGPAAPSSSGSSVDPPAAGGPSLTPEGDPLILPGQRELF